MEQSKSRTLAMELADYLRREASAFPLVGGNGGLSDELAVQLSTAFEIKRPSGLRGAASEDGRGDSDYWRNHGDVTGTLMAEMASQWGGDPDLYRRVGRLHDVDYLAFPHDAPGTGDRHPVPLVRALYGEGVHPAICRAILEHAPYIDLDTAPTSRLSASLSAAEDLATLAALEPTFVEVERLSRDALVYFKMAKPNQMIHRAKRVRVETNLDRYINAPLAMAAKGDSFQFHV